MVAEQIRATEAAWKDAISSMSYFGQIKAENPVVIVAVTAHSANLVDRCGKSNIREVIGKPVSI
jgi:hypothetical protein